LQPQRQLPAAWPVCALNRRAFRTNRCRPNLAKKKEENCGMFDR
jgi:hypothetical protein